MIGLVRLWNLNTGEILMFPFRATAFLGGSWAEIVVMSARERVAENWPWMDLEDIFCQLR
jgi:hypothetical protein